MTDQERADRFVRGCMPGRSDTAAGRAVHAAVLAAVAAVRADERASVVTFLREASFVACADVLCALADRVERGDHEARS